MRKIGINHAALVNRDEVLTQTASVYAKLPNTKRFPAIKRKSLVPAPTWRPSYQSILLPTDQSQSDPVIAIEANLTFNETSTISDVAHRLGLC